MQILPRIVFTLLPSSRQDNPRITQISQRDGAAYTAAAILDVDSPSLANKLRSVRYTPIVSVTVFVDRNALSRPLQGVGVLMPAREDTRSLGILFNSSSFEYRVSNESRFASFTVMMGGTAKPELLAASDDEIRQTIKLEFSALLGIRERWLRLFTAGRRHYHNTPLIYQNFGIAPGKLGASSRVEY